MHESSKSGIISKLETGSMSKVAQLCRLSEKSPFRTELDVSAIVRVLRRIETSVVHWRELVVHV